MDVELERLVDGLVEKGIDRDAARHHVDTTLRPLLTAAVQQDVNPLEVMSVLSALQEAARREGIGADQALRTLLNDIETGEYSRRADRDNEARRVLDRFNGAADEIRRRYDKTRPETALTFERAMTAVNPLRSILTGDDGTAFRLMSLLDDVGDTTPMTPSALAYTLRRDDVTDGARHHALFKALPRVEAASLLSDTAAEGEGWAEVVQEVRDLMATMKAHGAHKRPRGKHDTFKHVGRNSLIIHLIRGLEGCGLPTTSGNKKEDGTLCGALASVSDLKAGTIRGIWQTRHDRHRRPGSCGWCGKLLGDDAQWVTDGDDDDPYRICGACAAG